MSNPRVGRRAEIVIMDEVTDLAAQFVEPSKTDHALRRQSLFPEGANAWDIQVAYVATPGGLPDERITPYVRDILLSQIEPLLHVSFTMGHQRRTTLVEMNYLRNRGLPTDYEALVATFPEIRWSQR